MIAGLDDVAAVFERQAVDAVQQRHGFRRLASGKQMGFERSARCILSCHKRLYTVIAQQCEQFIFLIEAHSRLS